MTDQSKERLKWLQNIRGKIKEQERQIIFDLIRNCKHPLVISNVKYPWRQTDCYICESCGLKIFADGTGAPRHPLITFGKVEYKDGNLPEVNYILDRIEFYAIEYPRRFAKSLLENILCNTPFDVKTVMEADKGRRYSNWCYFNTEADFYAKH